MDKKNLLLLHGALGSASQMTKLADILSEKYRVIAPNLPGHGGLPVERPYSIPLFESAILAHLAAEQISETLVFGYSMGGYIGLSLASKHPSIVKGLATLGTKLHWNPEVASREIQMLDAEKIAEKVPQFAQMLQQRHHPADWRKVLEHTAGMMQGLGNGDALTEKEFRNITCPVKIMLGSKDRMVTREESEEITQYLEKGLFELLEDVPHPFEQVDVDLIAAKILDFFST